MGIERQEQIKTAIETILNKDDCSKIVLTQKQIREEITQKAQQKAADVLNKYFSKNTK